MRFEDEPEYDKLISLMKKLDIYSSDGIKTGDRIIQDDELNRF